MLLMISQQTKAGDQQLVIMHDVLNIDHFVVISSTSSG